MRENKALSVLVTAGGTREDIDTVRSIVNHSTGRLGGLIADLFYQNGADVTFLCGETAADIAPCVNKTIKIRSVAQLEQTIIELLKENDYDCVIHCMAVSDFTPHLTVDVDDLAEAISKEIYDSGLSCDEMTERIKNVILNGSGNADEKKISSKSPYLALILKQTPKVIGRIKELRPNTLLVGFKLLSGVSEHELVEAGLKLIKSNGCDYVVANDLKDISEDTHKAVLINKSGIVSRAGTKKDIAEMIYTGSVLNIGKNSAVID